MKRMTAMFAALLLGSSLNADVVFVGPVVSATRSIGSEGESVAAIWTGVSAGVVKSEGVSAIVTTAIPAQIRVGSTVVPVNGASVSALVGRSLFVRPGASLMVGGYVDIIAISTAIDEAIEIGLGGGASWLIGQGPLRGYVSTVLSALSACVPSGNPFGSDRKPCPMSSVGISLGGVASF